MGKYIITFLLLNIAIVGQSQTRCDSLFHFYTPMYSTLRSIQLVVNQLELCNLSISGVVQNGFSHAKSGNGKLEPNRGIVFQNNDTYNYPMALARQRIINESQVSFDKITEKHRNSRDRISRIAFRIGAGLGVGCYAVTVYTTAGTASPICNPLAGLAVGGATYLGGNIANYWLNGDEDTAIKEVRKLQARKLALLEAQGKEIDTKCRSDIDCITNILVQNTLGLSNEDAHLMKNTTENLSTSYETLRQLRDELYPNGVPASREEIQRELREVEENLRKETKKLNATIERNHLEVMRELNNFSLSLEEVHSILADFQQDFHLNMDIMNSKLDNILNGNRVIFSELQEHRRLLNQNVIDNSIIQHILMRDLSGSQTYDFYYECAFGTGPCPSALAAYRDNNPVDFYEEFQRLEKVKKAEKIIKEADKVMEILQAGGEIADAIGVDGKTAQAIGKTMFYAQSAYSLIAGGAQLYTGDLRGIVSIIKGAAGLIRGQKGSQPSPEMQAIIQLTEQMHERFDRIEKQLANIAQLQLDLHADLSRNIQANRELMTYEFNNSIYLIGEVLDRQELMQSQLRDLLNNDFSNCNRLMLEIDSSDVLSSLDIYQNYIDIYEIEPSACDDCLKGIREHLSRFSTVSFDGELNLNLSPFTVRSESDNYAAVDRDNFRKAVAFFRWFYSQGKDLDEALQLLLVTSRKVTESQDIYIGLRNDTINFNLASVDALNDNFYLDAFAFKDFINVYSTFYPYFEIQNTDDTYRPFPIEEYIQFTSFPRTEGMANLANSRKNLLENDITTLSSISTIIKSQQSLMNGHMLIQPMYHIIYQNQFSDAIIRFNNRNFSPKQMAIEILNSNPVLAQNFAVYVLRKNYRLNEIIPYNGAADSTLFSNEYDIFKNNAYVEEDINIDILESNSYLDELKFTKAGDTSNEIVMLDIEMEEGCNLNDFVSCSAKIPIPPSSFIESNEMSTTHAFEFASQTDLQLNALRQEIMLPDGFNNNWLELMQIKLSFLEPTN